MKILDEIYSNVCGIRDNVVNEDRECRSRPRLAIYVSPDFYEEMMNEIARNGQVPRHEYELMTNQTFLGMPVYRAIGMVNGVPHPPYQIVHVGWEDGQ